MTDNWDEMFPAAKKSDGTIHIAMNYSGTVEQYRAAEHADERDVDHTKQSGDDHNINPMKGEDLL